MLHIIHFDSCKFTLKIAETKKTATRRGNANLLLAEKQL